MARVVPKPNRLVLLALVAISVLSVPAFCTRFLNDMDYYSLVAGKLIGGGMLYRDAIDTKPPLIFVHYAVVFRLFGHNNITAVKIVTMIWLAASALVMCAIRRELSPSAKTPQLAALLFVLASFSGWGEDFLSSNTEILSNLFILLGVWCMVKDDFSADAGRLVLGGALLGVAFLYRYQAAAPLAAYVFTVWLLRKRFSRILFRLCLVGFGWLVPLAALTTYYARIGGLSDLAFFLRYQSYYVRGHEVYWPQALGQVVIVAVSQAPFLLLAAWQATALIRAPERSRGELFLLLFLGFSLCTFFVGGHFYPHYVIQTIPALVLLATESLSQPPSAGPLTRRKGFRSFYTRHAHAFILLNVTMFSIINAVYYSIRPADVPSPNLIHFATEHTSRRDSVFVWTWRSHLLFEIDRVFATRFLSNEFLTGRLYGTRHRLRTATADSARSAAVPELWPVLLRDLEAVKPRLIVDDAPDRSKFTIDHYPALSSFVETHYEPGRVMDGLCVYLRKAG